MAKKKKPRTNVEFVRDLMEFSNYGPLAQIFVMDAIAKFADAVAATKPEDYELRGTMLMVHPKAWVGVAKEISRKLKEEGY